MPRVTTNTPITENSTPSTSPIKRAMRITSGKPEFITARGNAHLLAGNLKKAQADFNAALRKNDQLAVAFLGRGHVHSARGDIERALEDWLATLKNDPDLLPARYNYALALHKTGASNRAIKEITRTLNVNRDFPLPYGLLGMIFAEKEDYRRALQAGSCFPAEHGNQREQAEYHRHHPQLEAHVVVGAGHAGPKSPVGRKELEEFDEIAAPGIAPAVPLVDAHKDVLRHGWHRKESTKAQSQDQTRTCRHQDVPQMPEQRQDRLP